MTSEPNALPLPAVRDPQTGWGIVHPVIDRSYNRRIAGPQAEKDAMIQVLQAC